MSRQWRSDDTPGQQWRYGFGDGSDGDLTISSNTTEAPIDASCSGTSGNSTLSATNASFTAGKPVLIHQSRGTGAGNWELNKIASYTSGTITLKHPLQNTYTDSGASQAQVIQLKQYNNVTVNSGVTWTAKKWNGDIGGILAFFAKGTVTVTGTISVKDQGFRVGGTDGNVNADGYQGESTLGIGGNSRSANGQGGGGGAKGATPCNGGGGGNHAGGAGGGNATSAGGTAGSADLTNMVFGGGGGRMGTNGTYGYGGGEDGGEAGGILAIFAQNIVISGAISARGRDSVLGVQGAGHGGGAGGSVLIKAVTATLGSSKIIATGGSGVSRTGNGGTGRIHLDYSESYSGTTNPTLDVRQDLTIIPVTGGSPLFFSQL